MNGWGISDLFPHSTALFLLPLGCPGFLVGCGAVLHRLKGPPQTSHVLCTALEPQTG